MKTFFLVLVALATICHAYGASCKGKTDRTFCPDNTSSIAIKKETQKGNTDVLDVTVECFGTNGDTVAQCTEQVDSPFPSVIIKSFQFIGNYRVSEGGQDPVVHNDVVRDDEVETFE